MQVITLLILVFLLAAIFRKKKSIHARVIIGSVFGIFFFSIWKFFAYYAGLYHWPELQKQIIFLLIGFTATFLSVLLVKIRHELPVAIISFITFAVAMIVTFTAEVHIKNNIAITSGFFQDTVKSTSTKRHDQEFYKFIHPVAGYQINVPRDWILKTDKGPEFKYFQFSKDGVLKAEFRPLCFGYDTIAITDIISNIQNKQSDTIHKTDTQCYSQGKSFYSCKISSYDKNNNIKRIYWLAMRDDIQNGVELDFVLNESDPKIIQDINYIVASITPVKGVKKTTGCLGLAEWF